MLAHRPRRLRKNAIIRELVAESRLSKNMFIYPYFVVNGKGVKEEITAMPGIFHFSIDQLIDDVKEGLSLGINKVLLFGVGEKKTSDASSSHSANSIVAKAVSALKKEFGDQLYVITDVCVCAYTEHGHCGILHGEEVHNDDSVAVLSQMALAHAQAGVDMVAPSDMMDGRIAAIRKTLDENNFAGSCTLAKISHVCCEFVC